MDERDDLDDIHDVARRCHRAAPTDLDPDRWQLERLSELGDDAGEDRRRIIDLAQPASDAGDHLVGVGTTAIEQSVDTSTNTIPRRDERSRHRDRRDRAHRRAGVGTDERHAEGDHPGVDGAQQTREGGRRGGATNDSVDREQPVTEQRYRDGRRDRQDDEAGVVQPSWHRQDRCPDRHRHAGRGTQRNPTDLLTHLTLRRSVACDERRERDQGGHRLQREPELIRRIDDAAASNPNGFVSPLSRESGWSIAIEPAVNATPASRIRADATANQRAGRQRRDGSDPVGNNSTTTGTLAGTTTHNQLATQYVTLPPRDGTAGGVSVATTTSSSSAVVVWTSPSPHRIQPNGSCGRAPAMSAPGIAQASPLRMLANQYSVPTPSASTSALE